MSDLNYILSKIENKLDDSFPFLGRDEICVKAHKNSQKWFDSHVFSGTRRLFAIRRELQQVKDVHYVKIIMRRSWWSNYGYVVTRTKLWKNRYRNVYWNIHDYENKDLFNSDLIRSSGEVELEYFPETLILRFDNGGQDFGWISCGPTSSRKYDPELKLPAW
jgi:hypothetical protein